MAFALFQFLTVKGCEGRAAFSPLIFQDIIPSSKYILTSPPKLGALPQELKKLHDVLPFTRLLTNDRIFSVSSTRLSNFLFYFLFS
jgi:hypothetical protein